MNPAEQMMLRVLGPYWERICQRFWSKVVVTEDCWVWTGGTTKGGYGVVASPKMRIGLMYAHRFCYELMVGPIPHGLVLDHLCRNPPCVRPDHLEPVTQRINTLRGQSGAALNAVKTHCKHGHELNASNVYLAKGRERQCRQCMKRRYSTPEAKARTAANMRRWRERQKVR